MEKVMSKNKNVHDRTADKLSKFKNINFRKLGKKKLILIGVVVIAVIVAAVSIVKLTSKKHEGEAQLQTATAERRTISRSVTGSSIIEANDTYDVTALVTGEILTDTFNEGDTVKKDDILYTIESSDVQNKLTQAENSLEKARQDFSDAIKKRTDTIKANNISKSNTNDSITKALNSVETAEKNYKNLTVTSDYTGTITEVILDEGDSVADGTKIAKIENAENLEIHLQVYESLLKGLATKKALPR